MRVVVLILLGACSSPMHELDDKGQICVTREGAGLVGPQGFEAGKPVQLVVRASVSGCPIDVDGTCDMVRTSGAVFEVFSHIEWNDGAACPRELQYVSAQCETPPLFDDTQFRLADVSLTVGVPSMVETPCAGELAY